MNKIKAYFDLGARPFAVNTEQAYHERMVRIVLMMVSATLIPLNLIVIVAFIVGVFAAQPLLMVFGMDLGIVLCWFLVRFSHWQVAGSVVSASFFALAVYGSYINGLMTNLVLVYAIVVVLVSMFSSGKASWFVLLACILTHSVLGALHDQKPINSMMVSIVAIAFSLIGVALLQWLATRLLRSSLAQERAANEKMAKEIEERKQMEMQLHYLGLHDAMTGLYNRFYFEAEIERLQYSRLFPVSIMMVDLDGLKYINDHFGHAFGDKLLIGTAWVLKETFRAEDIVARIGGDEFAVLFTQTSAETILQIVARLREKLLGYNIAYPDQCLEISIGVATAEKGMLLNDVLKLADDRMYAEKWGKRMETPMHVDL